MPQSQFKIKRHKQVYQPSTKRRFSIWRIIGGVLLMSVLFFVGYSIADPVMSFVTGEMKLRIDEQKNQSSQAVSDTPSDAPSSEPEPTKGETVGFDQIKAAFMPYTVLADDERFEEFIASAKKLGLNTAVIEVMDASGVLYYNSSLAESQEIGAVMEDSPELDERIQALSAEGIGTIAKLDAFSNPLAARKIKGAAARYSKDITTMWLDNYATEGGKPWISPESIEGTAYVSALAGEIAASGAHYVMISSLHYPKGVALNLAYFGPKSNDSRLSVLSQYITQLRDQLAPTGCELIVSYNASDYLTKSDLVFGGGPSQLSAENIAPVILPSAFDKGITIGKTVITDSAAQSGELTDAFMEYLLDSVGSDTRILPVLAYTAEDGGEAQINAIKRYALSQYILYSGNGRYDS